MDEAIEEVIKNIIHIDKNATELKEDIEKKINDRKLHVDDEIDRLRKEIVEKKKDEIKVLQDAEIAKTKAEGENVISEAEKKSNEMYGIFLRQKEELVQEIFKEVISK